MIKLVFGLALFVFIGWKVSSSVSRSGWNDLAFSEHAGVLFTLVILLMPINWLLESLKWHILLKDIERTSFKNTISSVLAGISTSLLTPNRIGNFIGRTLLMDRPYRAKGVIATIHSNMAQFIASLLFGLMGLILLGFDTEFIDKSSAVASVVIVIFASLILYYYPKLIDFNPVSKLYSNQMKIGLEHVQKSSFIVKTTILFLSIIRYLVFLTQFYLLLHCFPIHQAAGILILAIALIYLLTTILPSFLFGKLFVREASALFVLESFGIAPAVILITAFALWFINLAVPALLGGAILIRRKNDI